MMPTPLQQETLRNYLSENLYYRETYIEFYDHILSGLVAECDNLSFQEAVDKIVKEDFGGYVNISAVERRYYAASLKEIKRKYWGYFIAFFKFPFIGITALLGVVFYWIALQRWFSPMIFFGLMIAMRFVPVLLKHARNFKMGFVFTKPKLSVKDGAFQWLDYFPVIALIGIIGFYALSENSPTAWLNNGHPLVLSSFLFMCTLHNFCYYRIYNEEFKLGLSHK